MSGKRTFGYGKRQTEIGPIIESQIRIRGQFVEINNKKYGRTERTKVMKISHGSMTELKERIKEKDKDP